MITESAEGGELETIEYDVVIVGGGTVNPVIAVLILGERAADLISSTLARP